jgi:hypothetical protein
LCIHHNGTHGVVLSILFLLMKGRKKLYDEMQCNVLLVCFLRRMIRNFHSRYLSCTSGTGLPVCSLYFWSQWWVFQCSWGLLLSVIALVQVGRLDLFWTDRGLESLARNILCFKSLNYSQGLYIIIEKSKCMIIVSLIIYSYSVSWTLIGFLWCPKTCSSPHSLFSCPETNTCGLLRILKL